MKTRNDVCVIVCVRERARALEKKMCSDRDRNGFCELMMLALVERLCLVPSKFQKIYKILRHIKSFDVFMEH
jgi:hypothetical protein